MIPAADPEKLFKGGGFEETKGISGKSFGIISCLLAL